MKRVDVEKMLNNAADNLVPDVLDGVKHAEIAPLPYAEELSPRRPLSFARIALTLSIVLVLLLSGGSIIGLASAEAERVYFDVNPSVELVVNYFGRVTAVNCLDTDAEKIFENSTVKGKSVSNVLKIFITNAQSMGYFEGEDAAMYISVSSKNAKRAAKKADSITGIAKAFAAQNGLSVSLEKQNASNISKTEAESYNISVGKLKLIKRIIELDNSYTVNGLKDKSMRELNEILRSLSS